MHFRHRRKFEKQKRHLHWDKQIFSLIELHEGEKGIMTSAHGGFGVVRRLAEMGLTPGSEIKLLRKCSFHGPLEIEVRGITLALGYGLASKVFVQQSKAKLDD